MLLLLDRTDPSFTLYWRLALKPEIDGVSSVSEGEDHDRRVIIVPA